MSHGPLGLAGFGASDFCPQIAVALNIASPSPNNTTGMPFVPMIVPRRRLATPNEFFLMHNSFGVDLLRQSNDATAAEPGSRCCRIEWRRISLLAASGLLEISNSESCTAFGSR